MFINELDQYTSVDTFKIQTNGFVHVTKREFEVLKMVANGFSTREIAGNLYISHHTVISHRKSLIIKFKARNTAELVKEACKIYSFD